MLLSERLVSALVLKAYTIGLLSYINMIRERFELSTVRLEGGCSILLSYYDNSCNTTKLIIMEVVLESQSEI